jgi:hypothetical protein
MKKIVLNKKTLRVLTPADEALVGGGGYLSDEDMPQPGDAGSGGDYGGSFGDFGGGFGGDFGGGFGGGTELAPGGTKGTFDTECRCPSMHSGCPRTQRIDDPKCKVQGD